MFFIVFVYSSYISAVEETETCELYFDKTGPCNYKDITLDIITTKIDIDEKVLSSLVVNNQENKHLLNITEDTVILKGDKGYVSFLDINFDAIPDISITTSFGLANVFLDYWVYNATNSQYVFVGNYARLKLNKNLKTLSNRVKVNAVEYKNNTYIWQGLKLVMK